MPAEKPEDPKVMCDAAEMITYLLSKEGLDNILKGQKDAQASEPSGYFGAYDPQ